jgi:hypothetical protein
LHTYIAPWALRAFQAKFWQHFDRLMADDVEIMAEVLFVIDPNSLKRRTAQEAK